MTNLDAIKAKMYPYELPEETLSFLLEEQGLTPSEDYTRDDCWASLIRAVIRALWQLITLTKEKDNGSEIQYDVDAIKDLIKHYSDELGEEGEKRPQNRDMTGIW